MVVVSQRTTLVSAQQEEKFFYHADFKESDRQAAESKADHLPVFPDGPLHVSLGLRALSGDNRPPHFHSEAVASSNAQVYYKREGTCWNLESSLKDSHAHFFLSADGDKR